MIDVQKHQGALKKNKEKGVDIHNELKIITASQDVYNLWAEFISSQSQGELTDPESLLKINQLDSWDQEKDGVIPREFFKWLENCSARDLKNLALHLLGKISNRDHAHPKVTMKKVSKVLPNIYSTKEWLERCKRKQIVRKQIHYMKSSLGLFSNKGNFRRDKWKAFKKSYNISKATKNTLLIALGENFFSLAKMPSNKNKIVSKLSPFAVEFFRVFMGTKGKFARPLAKAFFRPYDMKDDELGDWDSGVWDESTASVLKLAIMDFRNVPGVINMGSCKAGTPYFVDFLDNL